MRPTSAPAAQLTNLTLYLDGFHLLAEIETDAEVGIWGLPAIGAAGMLRCRLKRAEDGLVLPNASSLAAAYLPRSDIRPCTIQLWP